MDEIVGRSVDIFHKQPEHQRRILSDPKNLPHRAQIQVGPETLDLLVSAIYDQDKNYIGPMVTWEVITAKLEMERRIKENAEREKQQSDELRQKVDGILEVVNAAEQGDLTQAVTVQGEDAVGRMGQALASSLPGCVRTSLPSPPTQIRSALPRKS